MKSQEMSDRRWNWSRMHPCWMSSNIIIIMDAIIIMVVYHRIIIDRRHRDMEEEVEGVTVDLVTRVAVGTVDAVDDVVLAITSHPTLARCNWI